MGKKKQIREMRAVLEQADTQLRRLADETLSLNARQVDDQARLRSIRAIQTEIRQNRTVVEAKLAVLEQTDLYSVQPPMGAVLRWKHRFNTGAQMYTYSAMRVMDGWLTSSRIPGNMPQHATWAQVRAFLIRGGRITEDSIEYATFYPIADANAAWRDRWEDEVSPFDQATTVAQLGAYARRPWYGPDSVGAERVVDHKTRASEADTGWHLPDSAIRELVDIYYRTQPGHRSREVDAWVAKHGRKGAPIPETPPEDTAPVPGGAEPLKANPWSQSGTRLVDPPEVDAGRRLSDSAIRELVDWYRPQVGHRSREVDAWVAKHGRKDASAPEAQTPNANPPEDKPEPQRFRAEVLDHCHNPIETNSVLRSDGSRLVTIDVAQLLDNQIVRVDLGFDYATRGQLRELVTGLQGRLTWLEQEPVAKAEELAGLGSIKDEPGTNTDEYDCYGGYDPYSQPSEWHPGWSPQGD